MTLDELRVRIQDYTAWHAPVWDALWSRRSIGRIAVETLVKQINFAERGEPADPYRILVESRWQDGKSLPPRRPQ